MSTEEKKPQAEPIRLDTPDKPKDKTNHEPADELRHAFDHCGGTFVGRLVPVQTEKENPFEHLGGKSVLKPSDHPLNRRAKSVEPEESFGKEDESSEHRDGQ